MGKTPKNDSQGGILQETDALPEYSAGFIVGYGKACKEAGTAFGNALDDMTRKALHPFLTGLQREFDGIEGKVSLKIQQFVQDYIEERVKPQLAEIVEEKFKSATAYCDEQAGKLTEDLTEKVEKKFKSAIEYFDKQAGNLKKLVEKAVGAYLKKQIEKLTKDVYGKLEEKVKPLKDELSKLREEISTYKSALEEARVSNNTEQPAEQEVSNEPEQSTSQEVHEETEKETKKPENESSPLSDMFRDDDEEKKESDK